MFKLQHHLNNIFETTQLTKDLVDRSLWQVAPDNLKRFLDFSDCFRLCFELAVSF